MRMILAFLLAMMPFGAVAQSCEHFWAARNLVMDAAGQCFSSALGQAVFDNEGCSSASLTDAEAQMVAWISAQESAAGCAIDASTTVPGPAVLTVLDQYRGLTAIPFEAGTINRCANYRGAELVARTGLRRDARVIGIPLQGATLHFSDRAFDGWVFVRWDYPNGTPGLFGWVEDFAALPKVCDAP